MSKAQEELKNYTREQLEEELWFYKCLQFGMEFQDYMCIILKRKGVNLNNMCSKKYQQEYGENLLGMEIKHDKGIKEFGNCYIEIEAINKYGDKMIKGGLFYEDCDTRYLVGDETECYIFTKEVLKNIHEKLKNGVADKGIRIKEHYDPNGQLTSRGMIIPCAIAKKYCERHYTYEPLKAHKKGTGWWR